MVDADSLYDTRLDGPRETVAVQPRRGARNSVTLRLCCNAVGVKIDDKIYTRSSSNAVHIFSIQSASARHDMLYCFVDTSPKGT